MTTQGFSEEEFRSIHSEQVQELKKKLKQKDTILSNYRREHGKLEVFFDAVRDAIEKIDPMPITYIPKGHIKVSSPCPVVLHVTDGHMGMVQPPDEIEGFGKFNPKICERRQLDFVRKVLDKVQLQRNSYRVDTVHILATGDNVSGDIHDELKITNAFPLPVQAVRAGEVLAKQVAMLAPKFSQVIVEFLVEDNHSRLTKKPQSKEAGQNSINYVVGYVAKLLLEKHANVEFNIYEMHEAVVHVSNRNYLIFHGHGLPSNFGVPWYAIERRAGRESTARMVEIMRAKDLEKRAKEIGYDKLVFGHFHTPFEHQLYSCGGSVSGTDAYDHKYGRHSLPYQCAWFVHPKYGEFDRTAFLLE